MSNNESLMNEIGGLGAALMPKTSKRILNMNAVKFKLHNLRSTTIRYEVIYKNLVRDLRKYFSQDFGQVTLYGHRKKS